MRHRERRSSKSHQVIKIRYTAETTNHKSEEVVKIAKQSQQQLGNTVSLLNVRLVENGRKIDKLDKHQKDFEDEIDAIQREIDVSAVRLHQLIDLQQKDLTEKLKVLKSSQMKLLEARQIEYSNDRVLLRGLKKNCEDIMNKEIQTDEAGCASDTLMKKATNIMEAQERRDRTTMKPYKFSLKASSVKENELRNLIGNITVSLAEVGGQLDYTLLIRTTNQNVFIVAIYLIYIVIIG